MTDIVDTLGRYLKQVEASNTWSWIPGIRLHPDDIEALPKAEPKPIWARGLGGWNPLAGTPIFPDDTIPRGGFEVASREWIAAQAKATQEDATKIEVTNDTQADTYVDAQWQGGGK